MNPLVIEMSIAMNMVPLNFAIDHRNGISIDETSEEQMKSILTLIG